jgi:predicted nucleotidyltransferase
MTKPLELPTVRFRRRGGLIPMAAIRRLARFIAERFQPDRNILFGSYAYDRPDPDSDVDLLVVMPGRNEIDQAVRIRRTFEAPFPLDVIVRTPFNLERRLRWGDDFLREIVEQGRVLNEKDYRRMGAESRNRLAARVSKQPNETA